MKSAKVTVLLPVYNGASYLREAIDSILNQTLKDFELLIINDGSTDNSAEIIKSYPDKRIVFSDNEKNTGLVNVLNQGICMARGEYIARMDCDDIALPRRLEKQVHFMDNHRHVVVCGTRFEIIAKKRLIPVIKLDHPEIKCEMLFNSPFAHPTVMLRNRILQVNGLFYSSQHQDAEDFEFWQRLSEYGHLANLSDILLRYRIHHSQVSNKHSEEQRTSADKIRLLQLNKLNIYPEQEEWRLHKAICNLKFTNDLGFISGLEKWFLKITEANKIKPIYTQIVLEKVLASKLLAACVYSGLGLKGYRKIRRSSLLRGAVASSPDKLKFILKCLVR